MTKKLSYKTEKNLETLTREVSETIEKGGELVTILARQQKGKPLNAFVLLFADSLFSAIINKKFKLGLREIKVILRIIHYAQYGNLIEFPRKKIMEETELSSVSFSKALRKLHDSGILLTIDGGMYLNPQIIAKGKLHDYETNEEFERIAEFGAKALGENLNQDPNIKTKRMRKKEQEKEIEMVNKRQGWLDGI